MGFDDPKTLGKKETGASVALPVFRDFMDEALKDTPAIPFRIPPGIHQVQINADTGARAKPGDERVIWEAFLAGTEPTDQMYMLEGASIIPVNDLNNVTESGPSSDTSGTGGIY